MSETRHEDKGSGRAIVSQNLIAESLRVRALYTPIVRMDEHAAWLLGHAYFNVGSGFNTIAGHLLLRPYLDARISHEYQRSLDHRNMCGRPDAW